MPATVGRDLAQTTLGVLIMLLLMVASAWVVTPFVPATIWAAMIVIATWPMMKRVQNRVRGKRGVAVAIMTIGLLLIFVVPLTVAVGAVLDNSERLAGWVRDFAASSLPQPPGWVEGLPLVGRKLSAKWIELAALPREELAARAAPYTSSAVRWIIAQAGGLGATLLQLLLILAISPLLWAKGELAAGAISRFAHRLIGDRGPPLVVLAGQAIRAVALGVVVTALIQAVLAGIGLLVTGVPAAGLLACLALVTSIAQLGPAPVLFPAVIWLYWSGHPVAGTVLLVWALVVGVLDNVIRPFLIKKGADLPLLLILIGVIGGLLVLGVVGLFVGPVVLAVSWTLLSAWVHGDPQAVQPMPVGAPLAPATPAPAGAAIPAVSEPAP